jgi:hypothetical protein
LSADNIKQRNTHNFQIAASLLVDIARHNPTVLAQLAALKQQ